VNQKPTYMAKVENAKIEALLPATLKKRLAAKAKKEKKTVSAVVRALVAGYVKG
jgi:hypothetical protein